MLLSEAMCRGEEINKDRYSIKFYEVRMKKLKIGASIIKMRLWGRSYETG